MDLRGAATRLLTGTALLGFCGGLAACNGTDAIVTETPSPTAIESASATPFPSSSATPSPSPSGSIGIGSAPLSDAELLEILPEGAERSDLPGAVVTAEYFIQEFPRMMSSGETDVWDSLSLPGCEFCLDGRAQAVESMQLGETVRGGEIGNGTGLTEANLRNDGRVEVKFPVQIEPVYVSNAGGEEHLEVDERSGTFFVLTELVGGVWRVSDVQSKGD